MNVIKVRYSDSPHVSTFETGSDPVDFVNSMFGGLEKATLGGISFTCNGEPLAPVEVPVEPVVIAAPQTPIPTVAKRAKKHAV